MAKHKSIQKPKTTKKSDDTVELRKALACRKKEELVETLLELARKDRAILRKLIVQFDVKESPDDLVKATRHAIADATDFDERQTNYNFDYDDKAYELVKRNFGLLVKKGHLHSAMKLSLELMEQGSLQVESSDEGLMTDDIDACLHVVINELKKCDLPADEITAWCSDMLKKDRVGFISNEPLRMLQNQSKGKSR